MSILFKLKLALEVIYVASYLGGVIYLYLERFWM